jgi:hypothetical protein
MRMFLPVRSAQVVLTWQANWHASSMHDVGAWKLNMREGQAVAEGRKRQVVSDEPVLSI